MGEVVSTIFAALIREVSALPVIRTYKELMIVDLEFLRTQSLCDYDRRKPTRELREVWERLDKAMEQHGLYESYKPSKKTWDTIGMFVEVGQFRPRPVLDTSIPKPPPLNLMNATELFREMSSACAGIQPKTRNELLKKNLHFLESQAALAKHLRDQTEIRESWKRIHLDLKRYMILKAFEAEPMKSKILEFLKG